MPPWKPALAVLACSGALAAGARLTLRFQAEERARSAPVTAEPAPDRSASVAAPTPDRPRWATIQGPTRFTTASGHAVEVIPAESASPASPPPLVTVLHAMCLSASDNCAFLRPLAAGRATLVCPTGNAVCGDGSSTWEGAPAARAAYVRESVDSAQRALDEGLDPARGDVLFGSSRGAFVARDVIYEGPSGRWTGLVLVGAAIALDPAKVRRAGVRRVLLAAPDFDGATPTMRRGQATLCRAGIPARFVGLGPHAHGMTDDSPGRLAASLDWVMGRGDAGECRAPAGG